jgi:hypothetical protein
LDYLWDRERKGGGKKGRREEGKGEAGRKGRMDVL